MEVLVIIAGIILLWMAWQLYRAKQFTQFKRLIEVEIKPQIIALLESDLRENRSELFPNTDCHIQASITYWCQYKSRILQLALEKEIITTQWLQETGNMRNCQHLFHIERQYMH
ncbi:hypothetical protein AADZ91_09190 [Colwelliaceae bacterium 6441]